MTTSLSIDVWGSKAWGFLHACSFTYPEKPSRDDRLHMFRLISSLPHVLPCMICRKHLQSTLQVSFRDSKSSALDGRSELVRWMVDLHNSVNERLGKSTLSYESVYEMYADSSAVCPIPTALTKEYVSPVWCFTSSVAILVVCMGFTRLVLRCRSPRSTIYFGT